MPFTQAQLDDLKTRYDRDGLVVVDNLIPDELLSTLRAAADEVTERGRQGDWADVRVVGRQFPPFPPGEDIWGIQHIMHLGLESPVFAEWYGSPDILAVSAALMGCTLDEMQLELFGLLVNPLVKDYALSWHRDDVKADVSPDEEAERLQIKHFGVQFNAALYDDECLLAVPGSHSRIRTPAERTANLEGGPMPGATIVSLKAGQTAFYVNNIVHKGKYNLQVKRRTLHGCYGNPPPGDTSRATNILQHGLEYVATAAFRASLPAALVPMLDRLLAMKASLGNRDVGFSQDL